MSPVRMHFWQVVTRRRGGVTSPVKYFFMGAMPELISSRLLSPWGISEKLGSRRWPLDSNYSKNFSLSSFNPVHCIVFYPLFFSMGESPFSNSQLVVYCHRSFKVLSTPSTWERS